MMQEPPSHTRQVYLPVGCGVVFAMDVPKGMTEDSIIADFAFGQLIIVALALAIGVISFAVISIFQLY